MSDAITADYGPVGLTPAEKTLAAAAVTTYAHRQGLSPEALAELLAMIGLDQERP